MSATMIADPVVTVIVGTTGIVTLASLLLEVAAGDRDAFEEVYRRSSAKLFGVCRLILPDRNEAEDALQDVYLTVWRRARFFDISRGTPMTWLITIARNRAVDRLRANRNLKSVPIDRANYAPDMQSSAFECIAMQQQTRQLTACINALGAVDAAFIRTAFFEGSTYNELAVRAIMPLGTVKSRIRRALLQLRKGMD